MSHARSSHAPLPRTRSSADALEKSQKLGEEGDVDAAMMLSQQAEAYKKQYDEMFRRYVFVGNSVGNGVMKACKKCVA